MSGGGGGEPLRNLLGDGVGEGRLVGMGNDDKGMHGGSLQKTVSYL
ncbi:hypothetical protein F11_15705 [Rhodospirillum rubrum F11]|nr:hypothetical protein F11_15705 [Rhodospirillum rubrum F11]